jgi:hypothetical protein
MSIQVVADGADGYRLLAPDGGLVGWVRGRAIGVTGFPSEDAAVAAAIRSYRVLAPWLERQRLHPLTMLGDGPARLVHDGAHRWLLVGRVQVARLHAERPRGADASVHAFEIVLKGAISEGMAIHAALVSVRAANGTFGAADIAWAPRRNTGATGSVAPVTHLELEA